MIDDLDGLNTDGLLKKLREDVEFLRSGPYGLFEDLMAGNPVEATVMKDGEHLFITRGDHRVVFKLSNSSTGGDPHFAKHGVVE